jgi:hypothetical protein
MKSRCEADDDAGIRDEPGFDDPREPFRVPRTSLRRRRTRTSW